MGCLSFERMEKLHKNIERYVQSIGAEQAEEVALKSIPGLLCDINTVVPVDSMILAMIKFQVEVLIYLRSDEEDVNRILIDFSKEAAGV